MKHRGPLSLPLPPLLYLYLDVSLIYFFVAVLVDKDNIESSSKETLNALDDARELISVFEVCDHLREIRFELTATVRVLSNNNEPLSLTTREGFSVNDVYATETMKQLHLMHAANGHFHLCLLGNSGNSYSSV
jgi:hypothetical protein